MSKKNLQFILFGLIAALLLFSFRGHPSWLELCSGLAFFLFGMQCMQDGLQQLAGGRLERVLARGTSTPFKSLIFGTGASLILQSTTVVSLLTIAFIGTGLITLSAGISIILGANLGASGGIWLLALAGQNISLGPFAYPMIVLGILASFAGKKAKALGRVLLGIAFILLAIDLIKNGFSGFTEGLNFTAYQTAGILGTLLFAGIGLLLTVILQSSHATLMLILTALSLNQIEIEQGFSLAIGSIVGSAVATGVVGFLGGERSGMRLAAAHVLFNVVTGTISIILLTPLTWLVATISEALSLNTLIQLALFYTIFNVIGVSLFWLLQDRLAEKLKKWIPEVEEPKVLIEKEPEPPLIHEEKDESLHARYLTDSALSSTKTATRAVFQELEHLARMSLEVICHALYLPISELSSEKMDEAALEEFHEAGFIDAEKLYRHHIKGIYSELLTFISRIEYSEDDEEYQQVLMNCQIIALKLAAAVKNSKHLQVNLKAYLAGEPGPARSAYIQLRRYILKNLRTFYRMNLEEAVLPHIAISQDKLENILQESSSFEEAFRAQLYYSLRSNQFDGFITSSLLNDMSYAKQVVTSLYSILKLAINSEYDALDDNSEKTSENIYENRAQAEK